MITFLLLHFVSRSYLILRPQNKSDPDPKIVTVLLRIWPWMFLVVVANLTFLVFIAGVAGWLVFPSLLLCGVVDLLALFYFCSRIEEVADAERGQTAESRAAFEKENQGFIYLASIASLWVPSVVGHQPQRIFLVSGLASLFTKVVILAVAVALAGSGHLAKFHQRPFLLFCYPENNGFVKPEGVTTCKFSDPEKPCFKPLSFNEVSKNSTHDMRFADARSAVIEAVLKYEETLKDINKENSNNRLKNTLEDQLNVTAEFLSQIESTKKETNENMTPESTKLKSKQKVRICEDDETPLRVSVLTGLLLLIAIAAYAIYRLHEIADYRVDSKLIRC